LNDTVINGNTYHTFCNSNSITQTRNYYFLRDSGAYAVSPTGAIYFSYTDFTTVFKTFGYTNPPAGIPDTISVTEQMGFKDSISIMPCGTFTSMAFREVYHFPPSYKFGPTREYDRFYAKNIGLLRETTAFYNLSPAIFEKRLVRYHLQ
jgi:hypothetical protein